MPTAARFSPFVLLVAMFASGCGDDAGGAGGAADGGGGGAGASSPAEGGGGSTSGAGGDDGAQARIDAEREVLDACPLEEPCPAVHFQGVAEPTPESLSCLWNALAAEDASGRFVYQTTPDGCSPCTTSETILYVDGGVAYLSGSSGPLQRCSIKPPAHFQGCLDALAAGEPTDVACKFFDEWVDGCADAEPACP